MININDEYRTLVAEILQSGVEKKDRTGIGTLSKFSHTIMHHMDEGFPLLHIKKTSFDAAKTELLWILQGRTDLRYLEDNGVKYWRADYERSGRTDGTLGPVYGHQWRKWKIADGANTRYVDQLYDLSLQLHNNPESRRMFVSAWNVGDMKFMALPPCHHGFQIYVNNDKLDLIWMQRSADVFLGLPYDIAMYGLLLELLAKGHNLKPGRLIGQLGDCHIYKNHIDQATTVMYRNPMAYAKSPRLEINHPGVAIGAKNKVMIPELNDLAIHDYKHMGFIKAPLNVGKK
jgi:thymidylate synthase|tara:strand:- start:731 stop:1594 length:864 start_codon:yes stop_codon:yes gene_type:complete